MFAVTFNWLMTLVGASLVWFVKEENEKLVCIALGSSAGIIIAASFFYLLLPAKELLALYSPWHIIIIPLGFICGVLILRLCNRLLPHVIIPYQKKETDTKRGSKNNHLMLAMAMHNIPEGMAVGISIAGAMHSHYLPALALAIGISIQNLAKGMAISLSMYHGEKSKFKAMVDGQLPGMVEVPCGLFGYIFAIRIPHTLPFLLSLSAGAMMFICIEELVPKANRRGNIDICTISCIAGFLIVVTLDILFS
jgi:ZIP family zinc transporter